MGQVAHTTGQVVVAAALVAAIVSGCGAPAAAADTATPWAYWGARSPPFWASLDPAWGVCDSGVEQSPINLNFPLPAGFLPLSQIAMQQASTLKPVSVLNGFKYECVSNNGSCGAARWAGVEYSLVQGHLHVSGEHTVDQEVFPAELHLVHSSTAGELLVVGVLFRVGEESQALDKLLEAAELGLSASERTVHLSAHDWAELVPSSGGWCQYGGSLTTPPCSEGVTWAVARSPRTASIDQLRRLGVLLLDAESVVLTERPVQPLGTRQVTCYSDDA